jgi:hypothetical protein
MWNYKRFLFFPFPLGSSFFSFETPCICRPVVPKIVWNISDTSSAFMRYDLNADCVVIYRSLQLLVSQGTVIVQVIHRIGERCIGKQIFLFVYHHAATRGQGGGIGRTLAPKWRSRYKCIERTSEYTPPYTLYCKKTLRRLSSFDAVLIVELDSGGC